MIISDIGLKSALYISLSNYTIRYKYSYIERVISRRTVISILQSISKSRIISHTLKLINSCRIQCEKCIFDNYYNDDCMLLFFCEYVVLKTCKKGQR